MSKDQERVFSLDDESLLAFAGKGKQGGPDTPQSGNANAAKVRRVMQLTKDCAAGSFADLRILDVGCGEGVYSIEAGLRGARVLGVDARMDRMSQGIRCAGIQGLQNVEFRQDDIRNISKATHGEFDVIYLLGILYHLDAPDVFEMVAELCSMCRDCIVIDTFLSTSGSEECEYAGMRYAGTRVREHDDDDSAKVRRARLLRSIDNTFSFRFTRESLVRFLHDAGFTSVLECLAPLEPQKPQDRVTLLAKTGSRVQLSSYPWINDLTEQEIEEALREDERT